MYLNLTKNDLDTVLRNYDHKTNNKATTPRLVGSSKSALVTTTTIISAPVLISPTTRVQNAPNMPSFKNAGNNRAFFAQQQPKPVRFEKRTHKAKAGKAKPQSDRLGIVPRDRRI